MIAQLNLEQEAFKAQLESFRARFSLADPLHRMRQKGWEQFLALGLPSREEERFRSIKWRSFFSHSYSLAQEGAFQKEEILSWIAPECRRSYLVFGNGFYLPALSCLDALPSNMVVCPLEEAMQTYGTLLNNYWNQALKNEQDPFAALNGALHARGAFIYLPPKTRAEVPLQILNVMTCKEEQEMAMPRLQFFVGAQGEIQVIDTRKQRSQASSFINQVTEMILEEGAHVHYTQMLDQESPLSWHFDAFRATLKRSSTLKSVCVTRGSRAVRTDYHINLVGENAEALLNGVWMLADKREAHVNVWIDHQAPACRSYQLFKGVLNDFSRSSFTGKILVRPLAQKTEAFQLNRNLILDDYAYADSKPNLEIFADDVKASHGATVGQLEEEQLFYMKTRGLSDAKAKNLLITGFCEEVLEKLPLLSLKEGVSQLLRREGGV